MGRGAPDRVFVHAELGSSGYAFSLLEALFGFNQDMAFKSKSSQELPFRIYEAGAKRGQGLIHRAGWLWVASFAPAA